MAATTGIRPFIDQVRFLYSDNNPIQTIGDSTALEADRVSVVRGRVIGRDYVALPNVTVSVLGDDDIGTTATREDGLV